MPDPCLVLVHSPLVGPLTWQPTAARLRARGYRVAVPSLIGALDGGQSYYRGLAEAVVGQLPAAETVLVGHSGAGALLPAIAQAAGDVRAAMFVDAALPHPGASWFDTVPAELAEQLRAMARHGWLPPWHEWFPPDEVTRLLPDAALRGQFVAEIPRLPPAYFAETAPDASELPASYVRLSDAYEPQASAAERRGWPTYRAPADHLAMLTDPERVTAVLEQALR